MCFYNNRYYAFGPVVRELPVLLDLFDSITWVGFEDNSSSEKKLMIEIPRRVKLIFLNKCGGNRFIDKIGVAIFLPKMFFAIVPLIFRNKYIHTRGPSTPAFIGILLSIFLRNKKYWHKYAVNWSNEKPSFFYGVQKKLLISLKHTKVTVNGFWPDQPEHCRSFENPCITQDQLERGQSMKKSFDQKLRIVFAGRMDEAKGINIIIEALKDLPQDRFEEWVFIGEGSLKEPLMKLCLELGIPTKFPGFLVQMEVHKYLEMADILVLPSKSEGFPKIVAEAWNYKVIPLVSPVGSLPHYLENGKNGFIMEEVSVKGLLQSFKGLLKRTSAELIEISENGHSTAHKFTFEKYYQKLQKEVFH
jgi:glycosyltransferase involved in cell wall biosynthesis